MKRRGRIVGFSIFTVTICILAFLASKLSVNNETIGDTGWTIEQFIEWAEEVQPVKEHKRWEIWKEGFETILDDTDWHIERKAWRDARKELMEPNEPFHCGIINDMNDLLRVRRTYKYEWGFRLPSSYEKLPEPVRRVLGRLKKEDVGKTIGEIFPDAAKPVAICALKEDKPVSSEAVEVRLLSLSDDKLEFTVETEPFILSDNPEVKGRIGNVMVLYIDPYTPPPSKVNICKPEKCRRQGK